MDKLTIVSRSTEQTEQIAAELATTISAGTVVALYGGMGMGKTAFTRGFARGMGYTGEVSSPTFALVHEYRGGRLDIFHFDMYRIESADELFTTGYFDYIEEGGAVITEWSENIPSALPERYVRVGLSRGDDENARIITIEEVTE